MKKLGHSKTFTAQSRKAERKYILTADSLSRPVAVFGQMAKLRRQTVQPFYQAVGLPAHLAEQFDQAVELFRRLAESFCQMAEFLCQAPASARNTPLQLH